jgi:hypothetical protein
MTRYRLPASFWGKMLGVHRGTISLVASNFEAAGLIHTHRGKIELLDKKGLKRQACACYDFIRQHTIQWNSGTQNFSLADMNRSAIIDADVKSYRWMTKE